MQYHDFTEREVEGLLRASEGVASSHSGAPGHARERHLVLTNAELLARYEAMVAAEAARRARRRQEAAERGRKWKPGGAIFQMVTAWSEARDMIEIGRLALNSPPAQAGLSAMFVGDLAANGTRLEISFISPRDITMRYVMGGTGVRTMPVRQVFMVVDRADDRRPTRLHIQTFYGGVTTAAPYNGAVLTDANGQEMLGFTGLA